MVGKIIQNTELLESSSSNTIMDNTELLKSKLKADIPNSTKEPENEMTHFSLNISARVRLFIKALQEADLLPYIQSHAESEWNTLNKCMDHPSMAESLLEALSRLLLHFKLYRWVARYFRPLLIELMGRCVLSVVYNPHAMHHHIRDELDYYDTQPHGLWTAIQSAYSNKPSVESTTQNEEQGAYTLLELVMYVLSQLLPSCPPLETHAIQLFNQFGPYYIEKARYLSPCRLLLLSRTLFHLLRYKKHAFVDAVKWSLLYPMVLNPSSVNITLVYLLHSVSMVTQMNDAQQHTLLRHHVDIQACLSKVASELDTSHPHDDINMDAYLPILRLMEEEWIEIEQGYLHVDPHLILQPTDQDVYIQQNHLCDFTMDMCGVLIPVLPSPLVVQSHRRIPETCLVWTHSTRLHLHSMALALSMKMPILLQGDAGVGKTSLVEEAHRLCGSKDLLKIHLGDQTDSKVLLGTYVATHIPGQFRWQAGILTTAVAEGRWILVEDIDLAPSEVVSVLVPLLESRELFIPSRGQKIMAKDGFRIFATINTSGRHRRPTGISDGLWNKITISCLPRDEIAQVILHQFPSFQKHVTTIMDAFDTISAGFQNAGYGAVGGSSRSLTLRDLLKWCRRVHLHYDTELSIDDDGDLVMETAQQLDTLSLQIREVLFREAMDCFVSMISKESVKMELIHTLGLSLGIPEHRVQFYIDVFVPHMETKDNVLIVGRATLSKNERKQPISFGSSRFACMAHSLRLLEKLAVSVSLVEPILLVGETGTGKTTVVQHLATLLHKNLHVVNMSQQSDSSDLLGGFRPVDARFLAKPLKEQFDDLFKRTFSMKKNAAFLESLNKVYIKGNWKMMMAAFKNGLLMSDKLFKKRQQDTLDAESSKKRKVFDQGLVEDWSAFEAQVTQMEAQLEGIEHKFMFSFMEGSLVQAVKKGDWVLLDEVNLATPETLECLSGLLQGSNGSLLLLEKGDTRPIRRHPEFRLFCCMNPANDAGKRDLPPGLRSRFSEFWVESPDRDIKDLSLLVQKYLCDHLPPSTQGQLVVENVVEFYTRAKTLAQNDLYDGANHRIHFSIRTLSRALSYAVSIAHTYGLRRSLYEGCIMTFLTQLNKESQSKLQTVIDTCILHGIKNIPNFIHQVPKPPKSSDQDTSVDGTFSNLSLTDTHVLFHSFWLQRGPLNVDDEASLSKYVLTPSVQENLANLARAVMSHRYPVLIQGPTSAGKTSMIEYLAKRTGHRFVRINNHEHTDLQEYVGSYVTDNHGKLIFKEGVLVEALRNGYWIVLDELNLAPSDVLEALNRLLDDNRELLIPETQEVVRPHPSFMLFATQNPPGLYGGRKVLSRAFRNRFLELHFDDIPEDELSTILEKRCGIAPSYAKRIVDVFKALRSSRQQSRIFDGKHGYVTLRDLFRWAERKAVGYQELAEDGYMILAEKIRKPEEARVVQEALEAVMKVKLDIQSMYESKFIAIRDSVMKEYESNTADASETPEIVQLLRNVVWTETMKRLFVLVIKCIQHKEPVLLVGETGCGKTTVCQVVAAYLNRKLHIINAHQHSETSDFLGSQRPVRGKDLIENDFRLECCKWLSISEDEAKQVSFKDLLAAVEKKDIGSDLTHIQKLYRRAQSLFEWHDGPLVHALRNGDMFLLDEISLADDSVLERLNSVLEPSRLLVLAEKATGDQVAEEIVGAEGFEFLATMNPGGDFGKKELSPALRNRFTEIWAPQVSCSEDFIAIINSKMRLDTSGRGMELEQWNVAQRILSFIDWFAMELKKDRNAMISIRDILAWIHFMLATPTIPISMAFVHGGCLVMVDGIGVNPLLGLGAMTVEEIESLRIKCKSTLADLAEMSVSSLETKGPCPLEMTESRFGIDPFFIGMGPFTPGQIKFTFTAPTTMSNCLRVLRAMQVKKPILLEGSPGVGKTSLIENMATISGRRLVRINLSEQTDLTDLFGSDLPVEDVENTNHTGPEFAWRDGPFLKAMRCGDWVLLDELNLASQQVLEGLNACLDHRGVVYIPELDREFACSPEFRVFAAQNPQNQGGGRKGLPKSFVNRFTQVYVVGLQQSDMRFIIQTLHPSIEAHLVDRLTVFITRLYEDTMIKGRFGWNGGPWEFNLRDILRWVELIETEAVLQPSKSALELAGLFVDMIFTQRMRTSFDRESVHGLFKEIFGAHVPIGNEHSFAITCNNVCIDHLMLERGPEVGNVDKDPVEILPSMLPLLRSLLYCVKMNWMALITGPPASGKTTLVRSFAQWMGYRLEEFAMNGGVDTVELLGGFEQADVNRRKEQLIQAIHTCLQMISRNILLRNDQNSLQELDTLYSDWSQIQSSAEFNQRIHAMVEQLNSLYSRCQLNIPDNHDAHPIQIMKHLKRFLDLEASGAHGRFEWIDGTLIQAMEKGYWVLIDNVNFCSASVLDRLNPLLEPNGVLMVNERGLVDGEIKVIRPHPNFRLFLTMDPRHGEISRAMRNRSIELSTVGLGCSDGMDETEDVLRIVHSSSVFGSLAVPIIQSIHRDMVKLCQGSESVGVVDCRDVLRFARSFTERLQRGESTQVILQHCLSEVYPIYTQLDQLEQTEATILHIQNIKEAIQSFQCGVKEISESGSLAALSKYLKKPLIWPHRVGPIMKYDADLALVVMITCLVEEAMAESSLRDVFMSRIRKLFSSFKKVDWMAACLWLFYKRPSPEPERDAALLYLIRGGFEAAQDEVIDPLTHRIKRDVHFEYLLAHHQASCSLKEISQVSLNDLNLYQRSCLFCNGKLAQGQLSHPFVQWLYPLATSFLNVVHDIIARPLSHSEWSQILECMNMYQLLWNQMMEPSLNLSQMFVSLKKFEKALLVSNLATISEHASEMQHMLQSCLECFQMTNLTFAKNMWKWRSFNVFRSQELFDLYQSLVKINQGFMLNIQEFDFNHPILWRDGKVTRALLEGAATLYYVNEVMNDKSVEDLLTIVRQLPETLEQNMQDYASKTLISTPDTVEDQYTRTSLATLSLKAHRSMTMTLVPVVNAVVLALESQVLGELFMVLRGGDVQQGLHRMASRIDLVLQCAEWCFLPPLSFEPFKRLQWILSDEALMKNDVKLNRSVGSVLQDAIQIYHQLGWSTLYGEMLQRLMSESTLELDFKYAVKEPIQEIPHSGPHFVQSSQSTAFEMAAMQILSSFPKDAMLVNLRSLVSKLSEKNVSMQCLDEIKQVMLKLEQSSDKLYLDIASVLQWLVGSFEKDLTSLAKFEIFVALLFITRYVPDFPLDPVDFANHKHALLTCTLNKNEKDLETEKTHEKLLYGNRSSPLVRYFETMIQTIQLKMSKCQAKMAIRPLRSQMNEIHQDMLQLVHHVASLKTIEPLMACIQDSSLDPFMVAERVHMVQTTLLGFAEKLSAKYPMYSDILQPLIIAVYTLKNGLDSLLAHCRTERKEQSSVLTLLTAFEKELTFTCSVDVLNLVRRGTLALSLKEENRLEVEWNSVFSYLRMATASHRFSTSQETIASHSLFQALVNMWLQVEERKREEKRKEDELYVYKQRVEESMTEEELEQAEIKAQFPDYFNEIEPTSWNQTKSTRIIELSPSDIHTIRTMHKRLFMGNNDDFQADFMAGFKTAVSTAWNMMKVGQNVPTSFRASRLGLECLHQHVTLTLEKQEEKGEYDFYKDANIYQVKQALPVLKAFDERIGELLERWPEHAVLLNLSQVCERIVGFSIASPLPKFMTGVETLLVKCDDWEKFASKEVSLKSQIESLSALIVQWRKLELNCWKNLLENEDKKYYVKTSSLWFHLYQILVSSCLQGSNDLGDQDILGALDHIFNSCNLGEFAGRLELLQVFGAHVQLLIDQTRASEQAKNICNIIQNTMHYYSQFASFIADRIESMKKPIVKELTDYVKIATWKDVNIFALKESATRSHHQLHKYLKKYREVLSTPVQSVLLLYQAKASSKRLCSVSHLVSYLNTLALQAPKQLDAYEFANTPRFNSSSKLMTKMWTLIESSKHTRETISRLATGMEDVAGTIIHRLKEFSEANMEMNSNASVKKIQKQIRKKSVVDLLKLLHFLGLPPTQAKSTLLLQSHSHIFIQKYSDVVASIQTLSNVSSSTLQNPVFKAAWRDGEAYFYRILCKMSQLRSKSMTACQDVNESEVRKAVAYSEELLQVVFKTRQTVGELVQEVAHIGFASSQMKSLFVKYQEHERLKMFKPFGWMHGDEFIQLLSTCQAAVLRFDVFLAKLNILYESRKGMQDFTVRVQECMVKSEAMKKTIHTLNAKYVLKKNGLPLVVPLAGLDVFEQLEELSDTLDEAFTGLIKSAEICPEQCRLLPLCRSMKKECSISQALDSVHMTSLQQCALTLPEKEARLVEKCMDRLLIAFQQLHKQKNESPFKKQVSSSQEEEEGEDAENEFGLFSKDIYNAKEYLLASHTLLPVVQLRKSVCELMSVMSMLDSKAKESPDVAYALACVCFNYQRMISLYVDGLESHIGELMTFYRSGCKLESILVSTFIELFDKGLQIPQSQDENEEQDTEEAQGTGIGEGQGGKDVSDEIEDQEQVEGMKHEEQQGPSEQPIPEEDNAVEMDQDFDGRLEDVKGDQDDEEKEDDDEGDEKEADEEMGDLDAEDADVVDEAMWADDEEKEKDDQEKTEKDSKVESNGQDVETVAQEESGHPEQEEEEKEKEAKNQPEESQQEESPMDQEENDQQDQGDIHDQDEMEYEENHGLDVKQDDRFKDEQEEQEEEDMELPEDMNLDDGDDKNDTSEDAPGDALPEDSIEKDEEINESLPEEPQPEMPEETAEEFETQPASDTAQEDQEQEPEKDKEDPDMTTPDEPVNASDDPVEEEPKEDEEAVPMNEQTSHQEQAVGTQGNTGDPIEGDMEDQDHTDGKQESGMGQDETAASSMQQQSSRPQDASEESMKEPKQKPLDTNPRRSLGDALKEWMKRLQSLQDASENNEMQEKEKESSGNMDERMDFEFVQNDQDSHDAQVMDAATSEQVDQMNFDENAALVDEEEQDTTQGATKEEPEPESQQDMMPSEAFEKKDAKKLPQEIKNDAVEEEDQDNEDMEPSQEKGNKPAERLGDTEMDYTVDAQEDQEQYEDEEEEMEQVDYMELRRQLDQDAALLRTADNLQVSQHVWRTSCSLTRELSFDLCEQLRLILEPTLATKLKGDYRTGKRLNMRKVIPYIASQFKKDKIWMRRTKPSKRTYQIMLCIDDSKSMFDSGSVPLAYESLALISKALTQLEAGDLSVVSFGTDFQLLHPFDKPFGDDSGVDVIRQFTFDQDGTNVKKMMESCLSLLEQSRSFNHHPGADSLWQLQIVISDGICQEHSSIRSLVRKAAEQRIMVVFIILDKRSTKDSIMKMTSVTYDTDIKTGRPTLKMSRYMDTFPFDYFIAVQNIESLPQVLSETLRQYFTLVNHLLTLFIN